jgi:hypothetical protein
MMRRSEAHDPTCDCDGCFNRREEVLMAKRERERGEAFDRVFEAIDAGGIELARSLYGGDDAEPR